MINRANLTASLLIIVTLTALLSLGFWQLDRAKDKQKIERAVVLAQSIPAQIVKDTKEILDKEYYKVLLRGHYDSKKQFIYDNQTVNSNAGYYVLTPFILNDKAVILVNRGFVPWNGQRTNLADISVNENRLVIEATLAKPKQRIELQHTELKSEFPLLIQSLDIDKLSKLSSYPIIPMVAQLNPQSENGFYRKWQPFYGSADKHIGYAIQWFLMSLVLCIIALLIMIKRKKKSSHF